MSDVRNQISRRQILKDAAAGAGWVLLLPWLPSRGIAGNVGKALAATAAASGGSPSAFSFGIMSDSQWAPAAGHEAKGVAAEIIDDVNRQFIKAGVKFVIQVGDLTESSGKGAVEELDIRARHNAALAEAGIRYFPLRGNHDDSAAAARRFGQVFPDLPGRPGFRATDGFGSGGSPDLPGLEGRTYAFTCANATFILLDQFNVDDGSRKGRAYPVAEQLDWIKRQLTQASAAGRHAFVFAHKNLLGQQHKDNLFGNPSTAADAGEGGSKRAVENAFIQALDENGVRYYFCGHDHMYHRSMVRSPDGRHSVEEIIAGSCSYKFYEPHPPYSANEQPLVQERNTVGYLIATVDGSQVAVRYYSVPVDTTGGRQRGVISKWETPSSAWPLRDTFGYNLNGKAFLVKKGESFHAVRDAAAGSGYLGTSVALLGGKNAVVGTTHDDNVDDRRDCAELVTTGWTPRPSGNFQSDVLTLEGLDVELGSRKTNPFVLGLSYDPVGVSAEQIAAGQLAVCSRDAAGKWVKAVGLNSAGRPKFVKGPYRDGMALGTYGLDAAAHTVWAVLDHASDFAVTVPT